MEVRVKASTVFKEIARVIEEAEELGVNVEKIILFGSRARGATGGAAATTHS